MPERHLAVVLVRTRSPGNLGSAARAAKNFGVWDLRLVAPQAEPDEESSRLASGAEDLLEGASRFATVTEATGGFDAVVATSSLRGREDRRSLGLGDLPGFLAELGSAARTAFVFGPERSGLTEEERSRATASLRLPSRPEFPTLNVSHAVAVVLAAARLDEAATDLEPAPEWAAAGDVERTIEHWDRALDAIGFYDTGHRQRSLRDWRRIVAGRALTRRELAILRGVANRILVSLRRRPS